MLIQKRGDMALKVLSGSANFSVRGLYVQSNNVFTFDDQATAALYEQAFQQSWDSPSAFAASQLAASWHDCGAHDGLPSYSICLSPHHNASVSLDRVANAVTGATSSVLFAIMEIGAGSGVATRRHPGPAIPARALCVRHHPTTRRLAQGSEVRRPRQRDVHPLLLSFQQVPASFKAEWDGGVGQVIHHKFVVTDFNGDNPLVFAGSSNLAAGGEEQNGDNLVCFADRGIATKFAIEAIQLVDHYRFRAAMQKATDAQPLQLQTHSAHWASAYYTPGNPKFRERTLLAGH